MAGSGSKSLKEYLKRYESNDGEEKKKMKKKKQKPKPDAKGVLVVDEDPVWQKPVNIEEENENDSADEEKPQVDEDIEVKRMRRLELLRAKQAYNAVSEDGSGWVTLSPKGSNLNASNSDMSPPRKQRARNDTPSPEPELKPSASGRDDSDMSPHRQQRRRHHTPSPEPGDLSPPRQRQRRHHTPSPEPGDLSPPRQRQRRHHTPSPEPGDLSPPRQRQRRHHTSPEPGDLSPPQQQQRRHPTTSPGIDDDYSPPRRPRNASQHQDDLRASHGSDLSPPRKSRINDLSPPRRPRNASQHQDDLHAFPGSDLSPPRKSRTNDLSPPRKKRKEVSTTDTLKEKPKTGLLSGREIREEILKTKKQDWLRFQEMDPSISGRGAEPVYRDKIKGERITKEEFLKSTKKVEEKPKEIKLEWGKGLAQKREVEARQEELEAEKDKPFARSRDDPELDELLKDRVRWGDPMAHLVKKKHPQHSLSNLGNDEKMKESGFIIPQDIPNHSWLKRGLDAAPNRYGIRPGRHWDGVDRSTGYEKELFKRMNEKRATEKEAYLWSVSDM
ncbi:hypothetical protein UlMin_001404 [Ulmus minor]